MPAYKLGRNAIATVPGVENDDIKDATINVSAEQLEVTVFGEDALTDSKFMAGLVDVTVDVTCTHHSATVGQTGTIDIAALPNSPNGTPVEVDGIVLNISEKVTPRGVVEYTVSYGLTPQ